MVDAQQLKTLGAKFTFQAKMARSAYDERLQGIATEITERLIAPFCKRWGVTFVAGMGDWCFYAPENSPCRPGEPVEPSSYNPALNTPDDSEEDLNYYRYGLPDEFWTEFREVHAVLRDLNETGLCGTGLIATYCTDVRV